MFFRAFPIALLTTLLTSTVSATSPPIELLQPRDLDGDVETTVVQIGSQNLHLSLRLNGRGLTEPRRIHLRGWSSRIYGF